MYKNQLQELAQRSCFNLPSYTFIREGPDHAPRFKAVVNFNGESFDSPHYCSTLRQAEHAAAEAALNSLSARDPSHSLAARNLIKMGGSLDRKEGKKPAGVHHDNVLGPVPSRIEVQKGMSELQSFMDGSTSTTSKSTVSNQLRQMLNHDTRITQSSGYRLLQNAYQLLKTELSVQKMVASISSDKAVWDAIVSNKAVKDLLGSLRTAKNNGCRGPQISAEKPDYAAIIMKWILGIAISKFGELIAKFGLLVSEMFKPAKNEIPTSDLTDILEENVRSSVLLSVVILLIVVVTRGLGFDLH